MTFLKQAILEHIWKHTVCCNQCVPITHLTNWGNQPASPACPAQTHPLLSGSAHYWSSHLPKAASRNLHAVNLIWEYKLQNTRNTSNPNAQPRPTSFFQDLPTEPLTCQKLPPESDCSKLNLRNTIYRIRGIQSSQMLSPVPFYWICPPQLPADRSCSKFFSQQNSKSNLVVWCLLKVW